MSSFPLRTGSGSLAPSPVAVARLNELGHLGDPDADLVEALAWLTAAEA